MLKSNSEKIIPKTILLVEDESIIAMDEAAMLNNNGYKVIIADSGEKALSIIEKFPAIDLILMDIDLNKKLNGPETAKKILEKHNLPIVFLTSHSEKKVVEEVENITSYGYVIKNAGEFVLLQTIKSAFDLFSMNEKIREHELYYHTIFNESLYPMAVSNIEDGIFFDINNSFCETFGYALDELLGRSSLEINLWVDPQDRAHALEKIKQTGSVHDYETKMYTKNREIKEVVFSSNRITINGKECLMSWIRDVTDDNKKNEQLQNMQRLESIGVLAGGIAHDFNNLLMGIFGNLQLAELKAGVDDPTLVYIKRALEAVNKGASLAGQLLTYSKGGQPKKEIILLQNLVPSWVKFHLSGCSNIKTEFNIASELWPVNADIGQLNQVISNLVINAKQAMLSGGKFTVEGKNIEYAKDIPAVLSPGYYILLSFQDQGTGIEPYNLGKIFDPFFSTKQNGHGLGLATAYSIINKHGGYLTVDSKLGQGANFKIYLPAEPKAQPTFHSKIEYSPAKLSGRILLMDDEPDILASTKLFLEQCGFEVVTASHGEEAISLYKKAMETNQCFDTVILDLTIREGLGGKDALKEIRFFDPQVRAIVASGYSDDPIIHDPHEFGFVGSLTKPYRFEDLRKNLEKLNKPKDDRS